MVNIAPPAQEVTPPPIEKEEKEDCPICQCELPKATTTLECGHSYYHVSLLVQTQKQLPKGRAEVKRLHLLML